MADEQPEKKELNITVPDDLPERSLAIFGTRGSGKTVFLRWVFEDYLRSKAQSQRVVLYGDRVRREMELLFSNSFFAEHAGGRSHIEVVSNLPAAFAGHLIRNVADLSKLTPQQLEEVVAERFERRGYLVEQVGHLYQPDGGIDIVFWSKPGAEVAIQGAIQVKHHKRYSTHTDVKVVREMEGVLNRHRGMFNIGIVVTNTSFTHEARAWIQPPNAFIRLHDGNDVLKWLRGEFDNDDEVTNLPSRIKLTTKLIMELNRKKPES